jgi:hypothetical protein
MTQGVQVCMSITVVADKVTIEDELPRVVDSCFDHLMLERCRVVQGAVL